MRGAFDFLEHRVLMAGQLCGNPVGGVPSPPERRALCPGPARRRVWAEAREEQWPARATRDERGAVGDRVEVLAQEMARAWARTVRVPLSTRLCWELWVPLPRASHRSLRVYGLAEAAVEIGCRFERCSRLGSAAHGRGGSPRPGTRGAECCGDRGVGCPRGDVVCFGSVCGSRRRVCMPCRWLSLLRRMCPAQKHKLACVLMA